MSLYKGKAVTVNVPAVTIADKFGDLTALQSTVDQLPEAERAKIGQARFEKDAIVIVNPQVGEMKFKVVERNDRQIKMAAEGILPMSMIVEMKPLGDDLTELTTSIDINIPVMLKPFVGPQIQKAADQFGVMMAKIAGGNGV